MITEFDDIQFKKILAQFNDMYGRLNIIECRLDRDTVISDLRKQIKELNEKLEKCFAENKMLKQRLRETLLSFNNSKKDIYQTVAELNSKYENNDKYISELRSIKAEFNKKLTDLKTDVTAYKNRKVQSVKFIYDTKEQENE